MQHKHKPDGIPIEFDMAAPMNASPGEGLAGVSFVSLLPWSIELLGCVRSNVSALLNSWYMVRVIDGFRESIIALLKPAKV